MKKVIYSTLLAAVVASMLAGCSPGGSSETSSGTVPANTERTAESTDEITTKPIVLRLGHTNAETDSRQTEVLKFKEIVEEKTGGAIQVEIYAGGVLGKAREMVEGLPLGTCEIVVEGYNCMSYFSDKTYDTAPYLYDNYEHFMRCWYESDAGATWTKYAAEVGYTVFAPSFRGFRIVTSKKPFYDAEGAKGLKIRTPNTQIFVDTWVELGAQATPMDLSETLTGLQQGTVEAQENPVILSYTSGFYDVCDYVIKTNHSCGADIFMMDTNFFNSLSKEYQDIIVNAAVECAKEISEYNYENESAYYKMFEEKGCTIIEPNQESFKAVFATFIQDNYPQMNEIYTLIDAQR